MIVEMLLAGGSAALGAAVGHVEGYLMGTKVRNISNLLINPVVPEPEPEFIQSKTQCQCTHGKQTHHSSGNGSCCVAIKGGTCACVFFVGREVKNPKFVKPMKSPLDLS